MAQETRTVEEILASWNTPSTDNGLALMVGDNVPEGDTRTTAAHGTGVPNDDEDEDIEYADMKKADLKAEIDRRNEGRDEDDLITPDGDLKDDLIAALEADDEEYGNADA